MVVVRRMYSICQDINIGFNLFVYLIKKNTNHVDVRNFLNRDQSKDLATCALVIIYIFTCVRVIFINRLKSAGCFPERRHKLTNYKTNK